MARRSTVAAEGGCASLGCILMVFAINLIIGGYTFNYCLSTFFGKTVPFYAAAIVGVVLGEVTIPAALICWVIHLAGVHTPIFH